jgi:transketolase
VHAASLVDGPVFVRISRMPVPDIYDSDYRLQIGRAVRLREGNDVTLVANGTMLTRALAAADLLADERVSARVVAMPTVKPLDVEEILAAAAETAGIVTVEEHSTTGGLGGAVAEAVVENHPARVRILGIPNVFAPTGSAEWLLDHFELNADGIRTAALNLIGSRH